MVSRSSRPRATAAAAAAAAAVAAAVLIVLAGCSTWPTAPARHRTPPRAAALLALTPPSVTAAGCSTWQTGSGPVLSLIHVQTLLHVTHAHGPQEGASGQVTIASMDVTFLAGRTPAGWAIQATPPDPSGLVLGNGHALVTAATYRLYLIGRWTPTCRITRIYWLPGDHH